MTLFDFNSHSEIKEKDWDVNTLRPPLSFKEILIDLKIQLMLYYFNSNNYMKILKFLLLRIIQRFSYNLGWFISLKKFRKIKNLKNGD